MRNLGVARIADYAPRSAVDAQFSLPYCIATTLLREPLAPSLYDERLIRSARVRAMMARIECLPDPQMELDWFERDQMRTHVEITLNDGRQLQQAIAFPADKPLFGKPEVIEKLRMMAGGLLTESRVAQIIETVERLDKLDDITRLVRLLRR